MLNVLPERIYLNKKLPQNEPTKGTSQKKPDFQGKKFQKYLQFFVKVGLFAGAFVVLLIAVILSAVFHGAKDSKFSA